MKGIVWADSHVLPGPESDTTPGFRAALEAALERRARGEVAMVIGLGDLVEALQGDAAWRRYWRAALFLDFQERGVTALEGNHDAGAGRPVMLRIGDAAFLHGHVLPDGTPLDPWLWRTFSRAVVPLVGLAERFWPGVDVAGAWVLRQLGGGRYGQFVRYATRIAAWAKPLGITRVYIGHLHGAPRSVKIDGVVVTCVGCCVNGRLDFLEVEVES